MSLNGKKVCDFSVKAYQNGEFIDVTQENLKGQWSVLFFYPADFTFVCPTELADLQDKYAEFKKIGCEIYSVSCDTHFVHKAWHESSDRISKVEYPDVYIEAAGQTERGTFVINPDGEVVLYEVSAGNIGRNADELFRKVQAAQFVYEHGDEVCPAKWHPGEETLKPSFDLVGKL